MKLDLTNFLLLDGGMGTMLLKAGMPLGTLPESMNLTDAALVESIHRAYIGAGAEVVYTNTFGANRKKLHGRYDAAELVRAGVACAKRACGGTKALTALDVGPLGELLEPAGLLTFDEAYECFREVMEAGKDADLVVIETMTDLAELRAAVLAARETSDRPIFCTMTFDASGRTFMGVTPECMAVTLEHFGVSAIGLNCSLGPDEVLPIVQRILASTALPVIVKPNAGLPDPKTGVYSISPEAFAASMEKLLDLGVTIIGGCCGTSPEYTAALRTLLNGRRPAPRPCAPLAAVCSAHTVVAFDRVRVIGERINPTGKKRFKEALIAGNMDYVLEQGIDQCDAGADILDVNVGLPQIDERETMLEVVRGLLSVVSAPLQIDSTKPEVLEAALRLYPGRAIVNSVNGEQGVLDQLLPIVKKYGACVVGLTLDENGIPDTAEGRVAIARRIVRACEKYGIPRDCILIDCLTLTVSAAQESALVTLEAMRRVKEELHVKTVLGVSNVSFGLPQRERLNVAFLSLAIASGLDFAIINPNSEAMMAALASCAVLTGEDAGAARYIAKYADAAAPAAVKTAPRTLRDAVLLGLADEAGALCRAALSDTDAMDIVNQTLIPALDEVGARFEAGKLFLPQLLGAAQAAQAAFEPVKDALAHSGGARISRGTIVIATVKGDIHDIGKNIVKVILENYGYTMIDLGRDVAPEAVLQAVRESGARLVGLSALMTTTLSSMEDTISLLKREAPGCKVMVGGAVLTAQYARSIGADYYTKDAKASADAAKEVFGG